MDCVICCSMPSILRFPRNVICDACYQATRNIIKLVNNSTITEQDNTVYSPVHLSATCSKALLASVPKWMDNIKDLEQESNERINFLGGGVALFRQQIFTDIHIKPGNDGPSISAHKVILASRSQVFNNMLDSDECKAPIANDTISLPELNHDELESLLEFLYCGSLPKEKMELHVYSLTLAADKYDIPYMFKVCEQYLLRSLDLASALDILEISSVCNSKRLREAAFSFIVKNMEDIVFSAKYEDFAFKNPHLGLQITRAYLTECKPKETNQIPSFDHA